MFVEFTSSYLQDIKTHIICIYVYIYDIYGYPPHKAIKCFRDFANLSTVFVVLGMFYPTV